MIEIPTFFIKDLENVQGNKRDVIFISAVYAGTYLLGIECDWATYHSAKADRDRQKKQPHRLTQ
jgi:hypothetical protein